ncbi:MAG: hypothetical protein M3T49_10535, partial [Candidatus Eremiobacteraeota bacterium]|nr:hypothetical protein [Candidatus Eremiobacteraeota bacterium]
GAAPVAADTQLGIQGLVLSGRHLQPGHDVSGSGGGALLELNERWPGAQLHLEGIPVIDAAQPTSSSFGSPRQKIGLFNGTLRFPLDGHGRVWAGFGLGVIAQRTTYSDYSEEVDESRLIGTRYDLFARLPLSKRHFVEANFADMPFMTGTVHAFSLRFRGSFSQKETAAETDASAAFGWSGGAMEFLAGLRSINYSANYVYGRPADRNVGFGPTLEARYGFGRVR